MILIAGASLRRRLPTSSMSWLKTAWRSLGGVAPHAGLAEHPTDDLLDLQEGWDDPLVYFAYVDKSMASRVQP